MAGPSAKVLGVWEWCKRRDAASEMEVGEMGFRRFFLTDMLSVVAFPGLSWHTNRSFRGIWLLMLEKSRGERTCVSDCSHLGFV